MVPGESVWEQAAACHRELLTLCHTVGGLEDPLAKPCFPSMPGFQAIFVNAPMDKEMMTPMPDDAATASAVEKAADEHETMQWRHKQAEKMRPDAKAVNQGLDPKVRMQMLAWMHQVLLPWSLDDRILFSAVELLDRCCATRPVAQDRLHAMAIAVIRLALKLEGQEIPMDAILATVLTGPVSLSMVCEEEINVLTTLGFHIKSSTPFEFITGRILQQMQGPSDKGLAVNQGLAFGTWQATRGLLFLALASPDFYYNYPVAVLAIVALQVAGAKGQGAELKK